MHSLPNSEEITFKFKTCICHSKAICICDLSEVMLKVDINTQLTQPSTEQRRIAKLSSSAFL